MSSRGWWRLCAVSLLATAKAEIPSDRLPVFAGERDRRPHDTFLYRICRDPRGCELAASEQGLPSARSRQSGTETLKPASH